MVDKTKCPSCRSVLEKDAAGWHCSNCKLLMRVAKYHFPDELTHGKKED